MIDIVKRLRIIQGWNATGQKQLMFEAADEIESLRAKLTGCEKERMDSIQQELSTSAQNEDLYQQLKESQAREAKLRSALSEYATDECREGWTAIEALALPTDDTALREAIKQAKREALMEAAKWFDEMEPYSGTGRDTAAAESLRRMAEELK